MGGSGSGERGELLSKAAGLSGGYVAVTREWIDLLNNRVRSFIYSTAPPPALAHAAIAHSISSARNKGKSSGNGFSKTSPASAALADPGFLAPVIRSPTVPRGTARLRSTLSASHPLEAVPALASTEILKSWN
jgi:7-keto-8-aminopelargonate synthetase-like enzyme